MAKHYIFECGICGEYHGAQCLTGLSLGESMTARDCRNDDNRYSCAEDYATRHGVDVADVEEVPLWGNEPE